MSSQNSKIDASFYLSVLVSQGDIWDFERVMYLSERQYLNDTRWVKRSNEITALIEELHAGWGKCGLEDSEMESTTSDDVAINQVESESSDFLSICCTELVKYGISKFPEFEQEQSEYTEGQFLGDIHSVSFRFAEQSLSLDVNSVESVTLWGYHKLLVNLAFRLFDSLDWGGGLNGHPAH
jgi:hypothetical protein